MLAACYLSNSPLTEVGDIFCRVIIKKNPFFGDKSNAGQFSKNWILFFALVKINLRTEF